ncbi:hypothetical protein FACS189413_16730 [Bacteroidia bacterium]|nr:hypothetical protein FACS189413_16730 [Bacteroidia bacterium]
MHKIHAVQAVIIRIRHLSSSQGTIAAGDITVYASNTCGNGTSKASSDAVTIDAVPPPAPVNYTVANGVYSGPAASNFSDATTFAELKSGYGFSAAGGSLLLDSSDLSHAGWNEATAACAAKGDGWRLPNIAELLNLHDNQASYGLTQNTYWSSTWVAPGVMTAWSWTFYNSSDSGICFSGLVCTNL